MKANPTRIDLAKRARYRLRKLSGFAVGDIVKTPMGLVATITAFSADGRVHLRYQQSANLVVLQPSLLHEIKLEDQKLVSTSACLDIPTLGRPKVG